MMKFLATLWSRRNRAPQPGLPLRRRARPTLECLEDRSLPSVAHAPLVDLVPPSTEAVAAAQPAEMHVLPFKVTGGGTAPLGIPVFPGGTAPHNATGTATLLGFTSATTGTFQGSFVFVAANGDRLAFNYGADTPGTFTVIPTGDGTVIVQFVAEFTPNPQESTGRFAKVSGGSFTMIATTEPFVLQPNEQGYTVPFHYTWVGEGTIEFSTGRK